ncbi:MAG: bifunctional 3-hydroxydecanoyl-ACP dehydratase/trans-2-decenoyl-ACP isomerase [Candidatus Binatia bacterium]
MTYEEFRAQSSFALIDLLAFAYGRLVDAAPEGFLARLPAPPMLMVDRILEIKRQGARGRIVAERDIRVDNWFFQCHFVGDPVQPGCLGVDAVWQLLGFYCTWNGGLGSGRALGCGEVEFAGQIRPHDRTVRYEVDVLRCASLPKSGSTIVIGDATVQIDGELIYTIKRAKVGLFRELDYRDYPLPSARARGGRLGSEVG